MREPVRRHPGGLPSVGGAMIDKRCGGWEPESPRIAIRGLRRITPRTIRTRPGPAPMSASQLFVGLDVGGTTMKAAVVNDAGQPLSEPAVLPTDPERGQDAGLET